MNNVELRVLHNPAAAVAELLASAARESASIVLTGGSTPGRAYERAAELQPDWSGAQVFWGDERCVPPDDPRSNYRLAREMLLDRLVGAPDVHRIQGELDPESAASAYEAELPETLDLVLLGLGPDGHIASLFPGSSQLSERSRRVTSGPAGLEPFVERVTLTLPAILAASRIVLLVTGEAKAEAVEQALAGEITESIPASLLREAPVAIEAFLDPAAAARL